MSSKKIWSLAIALAVMVALAGLLSVSTVVQAQQTPATPTPTSLGTFTGTVPQEDATGTAFTGATSITIDVADALGALYDTAAEVAVVDSGLTAETFESVAVTPATGPVVPGTTTQIFTAAGEDGTGVVTVSVAGALADAPHTYRFTVAIEVDTDDDGTTTANLNYTANIVVHVIDDSDALTFHLEGQQIFNGNQISTFGRDLDTDPLEYVVKGLQSNHKIVSAMVCDEAVGTANAVTCTENGGVELGTPVSTSGGMSYALMVKDSANVPGTGSVRFIVDTDTAKDTSASDLNTATTAANNDTDDDFDIALIGGLTITTLDNSPVAIAEPDELVRNGNTTPLAADLTIKENVAAGHQFGRILVSGRLEAGTGETDARENLDGVLTDSGRFIARATARDQDGVTIGATSTDGVTILNVEYTGASPIAAGEEYIIVLTANGDTGFVNRTDTSTVRIRVSAANLAPTADAEQSNMVRENDPGGNLIEADSPLGTVVADGGGDTLTYTVMESGGPPAPAADVATANENDANVFTATRDSSGNGAITAKVAIPAEESAPDTSVDAADDAMVYTAPLGWTYLDGERTSSSPYGDVKRTITVNVSDGVASNDQEVEFTITIDVNEPVALVTDADELPGAAGKSDAVTYDDTIDRDEDGNATDVAADVVDEDTDTYKIIIRAGDRDTPLEIVDLNGVVSDDDAGSLKFAEKRDDGDASHLVLEGNGSLLLTYIPPDADDEDGRTNWIEVSATDEVNDGEASTPDQTFYVEVTVIEQIVPITSNFVGITVAENSTECSQTGVASGCSLAGVVADATSYSIESGVEGGDPADGNYMVGDDGTITIVNEPDFEDDLNPAFLVNANNSDGDLAGLISVRVTVTDVNEAPEFTTAPATGWVAEDAQDDHAVMTVMGENGVPLVIVATDEDAGDTVSFSIAGSDGSSVPFDVTGGALTVDGNGVLDHEATPSYDVVVTASDGTLSTPHSMTITVGNSNEAPIFVNPTLEVTIPEDTATGTEIADYEASDIDGDALEFSLKNQDDSTHFALNAIDGKLGIADMLDYETQQVHLVEINVTDPSEATAEIQLTVNVTNVNDNYPQFDSTPAQNLNVAENTVRGTTLANYSATDADGQAVTYSLGGADKDSFSIDGYGNLKTLESLDADRQVPCGSDGCSVTVYATDVANSDVLERGPQKAQSVDVRITITAVEDSVSTLHVSKANPVPGTEMGNAYSALANAKTGGDEYLWNLLDCEGMLALVNSKDEGTYCKMWDGLSDAAKKKVSEALGASAPAESPYDLPATYGSAPMNFVETGWANWSTVLRIEVTAESPDASCGNGNQCVVVKVNSDSADDELELEAYRVNTPAGAASRENHYVAALRLVELSSDATPGDKAVYKHNGGGVPALEVDEEDEVEIEFGNLRDTIEIENEAPEVSNFAPEHERAFDDPDVDYTFTITDSHSGLPEPEDLPDNDGDEDYTPVVALISKNEGGVGQCSVAETQPKDAGAVLNFAAHIHEDDTLYCPGTMQEGEYIASQGGFGFAPIRDDKDFDEIDDGYDVETTIVLTENDTYYVTFIVCDRAGNCAYHDPDGNDDEEELAEITVDTVEPDFVEARTGLKWDSTDNEYDDDRNYIQVIFNDLTTLNPQSTEDNDLTRMAKM